MFSHKTQKTNSTQIARKTKLTYITSKNQCYTAQIYTMQAKRCQLSKGNEM